MLDEKDKYISRIMVKLSKQAQTAVELSDEMDISRERIIYYLDNLVQKGIVKKEGSKYDLDLEDLVDKGILLREGNDYKIVDSAVNIEGTTIVQTVDGPLYIFGCPYVDECDCDKSIDECPFLQEKFGDIIERQMGGEDD